MEPLRALVVEDSNDDADLLLRALRRSYDVTWRRVETEDELRAALDEASWDVVISDFSLPSFSALGALRVVQEVDGDLPFIILSGTIGEEAAIEALKAGAHDFLIKGRLARLVPAIERERRDADVRRRRRSAEDALQVSEERFRTLVDSMDDQVFSLDRDQRHDGVYGSWVGRVGRTAADFLGRTMAEVHGKEVEEAPHALAFARALGGEQAMYEWTTSGSDGIRHFQTVLSPRRDGSGELTGVVGVARDVTEQKRIQAQLVAADRMVSVGMIAAGVAHEINNPLASVVANLDLAIRAIKAIPRSRDDGMDGLLEGLADAQEGAERIRQTTRDLRLFSRADEDRVGPVDVRRVIESSLRMAATEIRHRARLVKDLAEVPTVEANESRLGQVFLNLVVNAAQAIPEGRADRNEIRVRTRRAGNRVLIEIEDTGCGMSPEVRARLFTPFFTTKPAGMGTGLGLSICQRIVRAFGGEITVRSEPGTGTTFTVALHASTAAIGKETPRTTPPPVARRGRILVVDDEPLLTSLVRRSLGRAHDVQTSGSATEALARFRAGERYDVVLCDLMMPAVTGMELYASVSTVAPDLARNFVFMTGGVFTSEAREFLERNDNPVVEKPFQVATLLELVNELVR